MLTCFHIQLDDSNFGAPINPYNVFLLVDTRSSFCEARL